MNVAAHVPALAAPVAGEAPSSAFKAAKARKLARIAPLLRSDLAHTRSEQYFDFLTDDVRRGHGIDDGHAVSSSDYDPDGIALFARHRDGVVLDVGAGLRLTYYEHVINFEIAHIRRPTSAAWPRSCHSATAASTP